MSSAGPRTALADTDVGSSLDGRLAVVMITRNRRDETLRAVREHLTLPGGPHLIVVDNGSEDGTADAVRQAHGSVEVVHLPHNLGGNARNLGVRLAGTPYVAFSDDDSWWEPNSLQRAGELLDRHPTVAVLTARTLVGEAAREDPLNAELAASPLSTPASLPGPRVMGFLACAAVVRTSAFLAAGGFHERFVVGGEEELLACDLVSAGWDIVYVPELVVHHHPSTARSSDGRRRRGIRNTLWFLWLRRPFPSALARSLHLGRTLPRDRVTALAVVDAVRGAPWVIRNRRVVPAEVERELRLLDTPQMSSGARRYVS